MIRGFYVLAVLSGIAVQAVARAEVPSYARALSDGWNVRPMATAGETFPLTGSSEGRFRFVGKPDGVGVIPRGESLEVLVNHELPRGTAVEPIVGQRSWSGALVSRLRVDRDSLEVKSGDVAFRRVEVGDSGREAAGDLSRLCSGFLAFRDEGFPEPVYLFGEEEPNGRALALLGDTAFVLPDLGRASFENVLVAPGTGSRTVAFLMDDFVDARLYMYVGEKDAGAAHPLRRLGLVGGRLYVAASATQGGELSEPGSFLTLQWRELRGMSHLPGPLLRMVSKAMGAVSFSRVEDGAFSRSEKGLLYFNTTGNVVGGNRRGRTYAMRFSAERPVEEGAVLTLLQSGDAGSPILNPDNMESDAEGRLWIQEDPNPEHRGAALLGERDSSVWRFDPRSLVATRVLEIDNRWLPGNLVPARGEWETSGIVDVSRTVPGVNAFLFTVQAHTLDANDVSSVHGFGETRGIGEGGQLLWLRRTGFPFRP